MNFLTRLEQLNKYFIIVTGLTLIGILGVIDVLTGYELAFSLFYLIPIAMVSWRTGFRFGLFMSMVSAVVWLISDIAAGASYAHPAIYAWNTLIRFGFFVIIVLLLSKLKVLLEHERESARTDYLTGALNSRSFYDLLQTEINRSQRYKSPFTIAYVDLDNFKIVNDELGHAAGDKLLCFFVNQVKKHLRKTDTIARIGGDEFVLLLPETKQEAAQTVFSKLQHDISAGMRQSNWPVTLSIGVLTCLDTPQTNDEAVKAADGLMYSVKHGCKNGIAYANYTKSTGISQSSSPD